MSKQVINRKKLREKFLFEKFADAAKFLFEVVDDEREAPDFIIKVDGKSIGVEVTELFISHDRGSNTMQAQESISSRIVRDAQKLYEKCGAPPAHVTVCFQPGSDLGRLNRDNTAKTLSDFVQSLDLSEWQRIDWKPENINEPLPYEISYVHALGIPSFDMAHWGVARAGWVAPLSVTALQARIDEKAVRLKIYENSIAENWLIIVADATKPSQNLQAKDDSNSEPISSPFARTFFYRYPDNIVTEF